MIDREKRTASCEEGLHRVHRRRRFLLHDHVSNLAEIPVGSNVYYDQPAGHPRGLCWTVTSSSTRRNRRLGGRSLHTRCDDRSRTVHVLGRDWAVRRVHCPRINVSPLGGTLFAWDGTYSFSRA